MDFEVGDTGSLWIYWSTNGPADSDLEIGAFIDVLSSNSGVIEFTAAQTFDFEIVRTDSGDGVGNRLQNANGAGGFAGPAMSVSADLVQELAAFTVTGGPGIIESNNGSGEFLDTGYDATSDAFQWGRVDFTAIGQGQTAVTGERGDGAVKQFPIPYVFNTATINVGGGPAVPEPTTTVVTAFALAGIAARRRR